MTTIETMPMLGTTVFGGLDSVGNVRLQPLVRAITASTDATWLDFKLSL